MVVDMRQGQAIGVSGEEIIGQSAAMRDLRALIGRVARSDASVLITGPSGSGKELVARALHKASGRRDAAFVALNCGAIPADLMESELFGHERGAFTGAATRRIGRFEEAHRGTLFLDEIGDMRFDMQVKLLRVLEDGLVQRVGGGAPVVADVRIISATHQDIEAAIAGQRFREDLYFRLGVVPIRVPSLAERVEDLPLLMSHFRSGRSGPMARFDVGAMARMMAHDWPGNVRELRNVVARADILFGGQCLGAEEVDQLIRARPSQPFLLTSLSPTAIAPAPIIAEAPCRVEVPSRGEPVDLRQLIETIEQDRIQMALDAANGVISEAARLLTLKRTTLIEKMRKYGVGKQAA